MAESAPNKIRVILKQRRELRLVPWSFPQLAARADVTRNTVINLADGKYWPKLDTAYKIAKALNTTVYDIWDEFETLRFLDDLAEKAIEETIQRLGDAITKD